MSEQRKSERRPKARANAVTPETQSGGNSAHGQSDGAGRLHEDAPELSRPVHLDRLPAGGVALDITASRTEAAALAHRFGFVAVSALTARVTVERKPSGLVSVEGRLRARIVQSCVITLDPVEQAIDEVFHLPLAPPSHFSQGPDGEVEISANPDAPDPLEGNLLDVGELVAEQLALAADPYPRRPGVTLEQVLDRKAADREVRDSPFASLRRLRSKPGPGK